MTEANNTHEVPFEFPTPQLFNHNDGKGYHVSSPSCSTCYLGFEATPEELRQMLWLLAVEYSDEVDATASQLIDDIREQVTGIVAEVEWKELTSFNSEEMNDLYEINEKGHVRVNHNGEIYVPKFIPELAKFLVTIVAEDGEEIVLDPAYFVKQQFNKEFQV